MIPSQLQSSSGPDEKRNQFLPIELKIKDSLSFGYFLGNGPLQKTHFANIVFGILSSFDDTLCLPADSSTAEEKKKILQTLREKGVFHKDIQGENFLRSFDGKLLIIDFGRYVIQEKMEGYYHSSPLVRFF